MTFGEKSKKKGVEKSTLEYLSISYQNVFKTNMS